MALFVLIFLIINNCLCSLVVVLCRVLLVSQNKTLPSKTAHISRCRCICSEENNNNNNNNVLEIKSATIIAEQNTALYKVDETLNLTCVFKNESNMPDVVLEWIVPSKAFNRQNQVIHREGTNVILIKENLQENDSGEYKCKAVHNGTPFFTSEISVRIKVKNKKKECTDVMFQCSAGICIPKRYTCDGFKDCAHGEDESSAQCGPGNPCDNKLICPDYRCIPFTWCCESHREPNCTATVKHSCCTHVEKLTRDVDSDLGFQYEQQRFSDMGFLQTTVYTVIGCAMAFMFIVTIIVIAVCRVHVRRTLLSRCPAASRNLALGRGAANVHGNNLHRWTVYEFDECFGRNDLMSVNPLLVTYNINNGVQFVGRPIDPPPYCEVVTAPPKEGPPPPYASRENLCPSREVRMEDTNGETSPVSTVETEPAESDALLGESAQGISVISCNAVDVVSVGVEECPLGGSELSPPDSGGKYGESLPKVEFVSDSSQRVAEDKNQGVNIIVVEKGEPETAGETFKSGESSSYGPGAVGGDVSEGAVVKLYSTKSLDSNFRRKTFSVNHNKKF